MNFTTGEKKIDKRLQPLYVVSDPQFTDDASGDFSLRAGYSPAIDAGDPDARYDDQDGTRNDIGALGGPGGAP